MAMLIHLLGGGMAGENEEPDCYPLYEAEHYIGRLPDSQICIQDDSISRLHARIYRQEESWRIEDLRSRNGIFVNGQTVTDVPLAEGDIVTTGDLYFTLSSSNPDQLDQIRPWVEERAHDAIRYHQEIAGSLDPIPPSLDDSSQAEHREDVEEPVSTPASANAPAAKKPDYSTLKAPQIDPEAPALKPPPPKSSFKPAKPFGQSPKTAAKPAGPVVKPAGSVVKPTGPVSSPSGDTANNETSPQNLNVMGKDHTVTIICIVVGILCVIALIWRFTDWFQ